jgi:hypothetical protein
LKEPNKLTPLELYEYVQNIKNVQPPNRRERRKYKLDQHNVKIIEKAHTEHYDYKAFCKSQNGENNRL